MAQNQGNGIYKIGTAQKLWSVRQSKLDNAVIPVPGSSEEGTANSPLTSEFGWLRGTALPEPPDHGCYVVEFLDDGNIRVIAYVDWFGRAFTVADASAQPPAKQEDLLMVLDPDDKSKGRLILHQEDSDPLVVASLVKHGSGKNAKYDMIGLGYDFGVQCKNMHYFDMMARAYLAFVYRTKVLGASLPLTPFSAIRLLVSKPLKQALMDIMNYVDAARYDPALKLDPALMLLSEWLADASAHQLLAHPAAADNLELARTMFYSNMFFIRIPNMNAPRPSDAMLYKLEGALNRFLILVGRYKDEAIPTLEQCIETDTEFVEWFAAEEPVLKAAEDLPEGTPGSPWNTRLEISASIENLAAPYRLETRFRYDHDAGEALFEMHVPSASVFADVGSGQIPEDDCNSPLQRARRYAMHAGLHYAAAAFLASPDIKMVRVIDRPINNEICIIDDASEDVMPKMPWFDVALTRESYYAASGWSAERKGDPTPAYENALPGASCDSVATFDGLDPIPMMWEEAASLQMFDTPTTEEIKRTWCASTYRDMTIEFDAEHRIVAKSIADALADCTETSEAIALVREIQSSVPSRLDGRDAEPCFNRLMEALTLGTVDSRDTEAVITCFQGISPGLDAFLQGRELDEAGDQEGAVKLLSETVAKIYGDGEYADIDSTVFRVFESYLSRLLYDLQRAGAIDLVNSVNADAGKEVQLAPDHLYYCLINLVNLLEDTFEGSEDAIRYGKDAIALAPTSGIAYRMLGRAYMLIGDMENSISALQQGLRVMHGLDEIAVTYYQLAYVLNQVGNPEIGALCYVKSIMTSPVVAEPATAELRELLSESNVTLPDADELDDSLEEAGIVLAPVPEVRDKIVQAGIAAMDAGVLPAARNLFAVATNFIHDDALSGIMHSLSE